MVSAADKKRSGSLPPEWKQLERSAEEAGILLGRWVARAREAEEEAQRLRSALEELADAGPVFEDGAGEVKRLKAENAALRSRMIQARKKVTALMQKLAALETDR